MKRIGCLGLLIAVAVVIGLFLVVQMWGGQGPLQRNTAVVIASGTSLAIKPELAIPVSSSRERDGLGTGKTSGALTFIVSQDLPFGSIHFNAGIGRDRFREADENPRTDYKRFSLAPVWDVSEQWKLALDVGTESARADGHTVRSKFAEIGAIYSPSKDVDLALGAIRTSDNENPKSTTHTLTGGVTWRF